MSRRKRHPAHANHERWLVSYADFITLMFAFFVVMYSAAHVDKRKAGQIARAITEAFQQLGVFDTSNTRMPLSSTDPMPLSQVQVMQKAVHTENLKRLVQPMEGHLSTEPTPMTMAQLREQLEKALGEEIRRREVTIEVKREGLVVSLREVGFFDSGSEVLRPDSEAAVGRIGQALAQLVNAVRIEGHTDNVPIHTARFASNWELSTARATEIVRRFVTRYGFLPARLSAGGYAEFHPVADNQTAEGRAQNRRVDIVVLPSVPDLEPAKAGDEKAPREADPSKEVR